ncbi:MAG: hypothetical protein ACJAZN_002051 [Planctomycetota bacterium]|jgi:hypothetical protein
MSFAGMRLPLMISPLSRWRCPQGARMARFRSLGSAVIAVTVAMVMPAAEGSQLGGDGVAVGGPRFQKPSRGYHDYQEVALLVDAWVAADPRVTAVDLGATLGGRRVPALRFSSRFEGPGGGAGSSATRTVLLLGGMDGLSQAGCEAVLWSTHGLLVELDHLASDLSFIVVPWAAPDALAQTHGGVDRTGRNLARVDDDRDGLVGEDGPDDLDGDGLLLDMAVPDPENGAWCFAEDHRFLVPARPGDAPRYRLTREGRDDDHDGRYNEDGAGGVNYNAHFPIGWEAGAQSAARGPWPLSESVPRRIADLALAEDVALCLSFTGSGGGIRFGCQPGAGNDARHGQSSGKSTQSAGPTVSLDAERRIRLAFERTTGRMGCPGAEGMQPTGRAVDWLASMLPCVAMDVAVWGPDVVGVDGRPFEARPTHLRLGTSGLDRSKEALDAGRPLSDIDAAWAFWLDDIRGGAGFQDWHPVDLGQGRVGLVGGWEPRTRINPPADSLGSAIEGIPLFVHELVAGLPRLEIEVLGVERIGDLVQIDARVINRGGLGTDLLRAENTGVVNVQLERVDAANVVAGSLKTTFPRLGPGASSRTLRWMIQAKPGSSIRIRATAKTSPVALREVRS